MRRRHRDRDRGTVVILIPVAAVIVLVLASIAVDSTAMFLTRRSASDIAAAAANDAVAAGFDADRFARTGEMAIDPVRAEAVARRSVAVHRDQLPSANADVTVRVDPGGPGTPPSVTVRIVTSSSGVVFRRTETIEASATASPRITR